MNRIQEKVAEERTSFATREEAVIHHLNMASATVLDAFEGTKADNIFLNLSKVTAQTAKNLYNVNEDEKAILQVVEKPVQAVLDFTVSDVTENFKSKTLRKAGFSNRVINSLENIGVSTVGQLLLLSMNDLHEVRNFGKKSMREIARFYRDNDVEPMVIIDDNMYICALKEITPVIHINGATDVDGENTYSEDDIKD